MKLAFVTETYPPEINGVARTIARLANGLAARGHEVRVIRPHQKSADDDDSRIRHTLVPGGPLPRYQGLRFGWPASRRLRRAWRAERPDLVHLVTEGPLGWSALRAAERLSIPAISSFHTNFHAYGRYYGYGVNLAINYLRRFHNRTTLTLVPSPTMRDRLAAGGFERLEVLARGVDSDHFSPVHRDPVLRELWGAHDATPVVAYCGRLAAEKNVALLSRAFDAIEAIAPMARLVFVGDGPLAAELRRRHPRATFTGMRTGDDLSRHYASADIFLFPSLTDTFGNVVTEAMASALAVVAFSEGAAAMHIVNGTNGMTSPSDDEPAFVHAASSLAVDITRARAIGAAARATATMLTWNRVLDRYEELIGSEPQQRGAIPPPTRPRDSRPPPRPFHPPTVA